MTEPTSPRTSPDADPEEAIDHHSIAAIKATAMENDCSPTLQREFSLPSGSRLRRFVLIGLALAGKLKRENLRDLKDSRSTQAWMSEVKSCDWDGIPVFWTPSEAWALEGGKWSEINAADASDAVVLSAAAFGKRFGALPPLPKAAFTSAESAARGDL